MAGLGLAAERFTHEFSRLTREASEALGRLESLIDKPVALRQVQALSGALDALRNDILALGPLFYIRRPTREKPLSLKRVVENVLLLNKGQITDAKIHVEIREISPLTVLMREGQCTQILNNLVDNAAFWLSRKSQENDRKLRVVIHGGAGAIVVSDNGPGIMPKYRSRLFQPFFSTKPDARSEGRGLGLYISKETLKQVGGSIDFVDDPTESYAFPNGATFKVVFPSKIVQKGDGAGE